MNFIISQNIDGSDSIKSIFITIAGSLILGFTMVNTYFPSLPVNIAGLILTSSFIYYRTLRKNQIFSFIMVMYFCSMFPFINPQGGGFNWVALVNMVLYLIFNRKLAGDINIKDRWFLFFLFLFILSSVLGWFFNFPGTIQQLPFTIISFFGSVFLLITSSKLFLTNKRVKIFLKINLIILLYSLFLSINKYVNIITVHTFITPIYGEVMDFFEGGGMIGNSPKYGEHSMILFILFLIFYVFRKMSLIDVSRKFLLLGAGLSLINVFMSISRSILLLTMYGFILVIIFQFKIYTIKLTKQISQLVTILLFSGLIIYIIYMFNLNYVFERMENLAYQNYRSGGITIDRIIDGTAFNRGAAFYEGFQKYNSKESWIIGYGFNIPENQRIAYFVDPNIKRGSAHSQFFAVLFLFGWLGFIGYYGISLRLIQMSYRSLNRSYMNNRLFAFFSFITMILFTINGIKADTFYHPSYFAVTLIIIGLGFANINTSKLLS